MNKTIENIKYTNYLSLYLIHYIQRFFRYIKYDRLDDATYLKLMFERKQGYKLDLDNPKTLNEKIQWLKIHDRKPLYTICADKYAIRDYISEKFGDKYLIPLVMHTSDVKQLNANNLPDYPFIIKANHDSGNYKIIRDKNNVDWAKQQLICKSWLLNNYFPIDREWQYKNIKPQIVVEKLLIQKDGKIPNDYKLHIINGKVEFTYVSYDREGLNKRYIYNREWMPLDFTWANKSKDISKIKGPEIPPPDSLQEMYEIAEKIALDYPKYIRVDFYDVDGKLYLGEITQHHAGGFDQIKPFEFDLKYGEMININQ